MPDAAVPSVGLPRIIAASLAAAAGLSAGCAGGDEAGDAGAYLARAEAACAEHARRVEAIHARLGGAAPGRDRRAAYEAARADAAAAQALRVRALDAPAGLEEQHFSLIRAHADHADAQAEVAARARAGDPAARRRAEARREAFADGLLATARSMGLRVCARRLAPDAEAAARATIRRALSGSAPRRSCTEDVTARFLRLSLGGSQASCRRALAALGSGMATVTPVAATGVDGVRAEVTVDVGVGGGASRRLDYDLAWDDEAAAWRIDIAHGAAPPPPSPGAPSVPHPSGEDTA